MGLPYLTFMGRTLKNKKKLTPIQIINSASLNGKNILNSVVIFNDSSVINCNFRQLG